MRPKRTILCVDDNEQSLSVRKVMLETRGYRVIPCSDGALALETFRKGGVDLVLTDLVMPEMDGIELINHIKTISPETPAILFSGKIGAFGRAPALTCSCPKALSPPPNCWNESAFC